MKIKTRLFVEDLNAPLSCMLPACQQRRPKRPLSTSLNRTNTSGMREGPWHCCRAFARVDPSPRVWRRRPLRLVPIEESRVCAVWESRLRERLRVHHSPRNPSRPAVTTHPVSRKVCHLELADSSASSSFARRRCLFDPMSGR